MKTHLKKLIKFQINTEWDQGIPTNTEERTPVYVNPEQIQIIQVYPYTVLGSKEDSKIDKVMITFGTDMDIIVDESLEDVLKIVQDLYALGDA